MNDLHFIFFSLVSCILGATNIEEGCTLPQFLENGKWTIFGGTRMKPGEMVSVNTIMIVSCNTDFTLYPSYGLTICTSAGWTETSYKCYKTCPSIDTTEKLTASCSFNGGNISCDTLYDGTTVVIKCAPLYGEPLSFRNKFRRKCENGSWNRPLPKCEPVCGLTPQKAEILLIGAENCQKGDYPWQVGLYISKTLEQICGGSIITPKITISAAHCFEFNDPNKYVLAAGKFYRQYNHIEDIYAQYSKIKEIIKHRKYNEDGNEANDIAILILANPFKFGPYVLPVCYESKEYFNYSTLHNKTGVVVGWGYTTETESPSETLNQLHVKYKSKEECEINRDFKYYYQPYAQDKICAGLLHQGKSACKGDSGGGLVFRDDNDRYFIRGIVSVAPQRQGSGCNSSQLTLYTGVSYHEDMISKVILNADYSLSIYPTTPSNSTTLRPITGTTTENIDFSGGCPLPQYPEYGTWTIYGGSQKRPGEIVSENTIIIMSCNTGFMLYPSNGFITCTSTRWTKTSYKCFKTCPSIDTTESLIARCSFNGSNISCKTPYDGTTATFKCGSFYEDASLKNRPQRICHDGSWNSPLPNCEPVCGLSSHKAETLLIGGENVAKEDYPWQVGLYKYFTKILICGGSVITARITITAAHCFEYDDPNKYLVAAGKYYRQYKHPEDKYAQYSEVQKIIKHKTYNMDLNEANDIAILILTKPFKFGSYVLPVCFDHRKNFDYSTLNRKTGMVVGWGFTEETKSPSKTLKQLQVEYKSVPECDINRDFKFFYQPYAEDKICAGLLHQGKSTCKGDNGGGLVFRDDYSRYFIRGIVSVFTYHEGSNCNSSHLTLYTGVSFHVDMISRAMNEYP